MLTADLDLAREFVAQPDYDLIAAITGQPVERFRRT